jgi:hypothetical protein
MVKTSIFLVPFSNKGKHIYQIAAHAAIGKVSKAALSTKKSQTIRIVASVVCPSLSLCRFFPPARIAHMRTTATIVPAFPWLLFRRAAARRGNLLPKAWSTVDILSDCSQDAGLSTYGCSAHRRG